jgi:hypothetical protein
MEMRTGGSPGLGSSLAWPEAQGAAGGGRPGFPEEGPLAGAAPAQGMARRAEGSSGGTAAPPEPPPAPEGADPFSASLLPGAGPLPGTSAAGLVAFWPVPSPRPPLGPDGLQGRGARPPVRETPAVAPVPGSTGQRGGAAWTAYGYGRRPQAPSAPQPPFPALDVMV